MRKRIRLQITFAFLFLVSLQAFAQQRVVLEHDFSHDEPVVNEAGHVGHRFDKTVSLPIQIKADRFYEVQAEGRSTSLSPMSLKLRNGKDVIWQSRLDFVEVWTAQSQLFQVATNGAMNLELSAPARATIDIANLRVTELSRDELIAKMKADFHEREGENLLRVSTFALGLPSGGGIGRELSDEFFTIEGDANVIGPSHGATLHVKTDQNVRIFLPPDELHWTFTKHTASIFVRGNGRAALHISGDSAYITGAAIQAKPNEWSRIAFAFDPKFMAKEHQLMLEASGDLWFDAAKVELGENATDYQPRCEVSLGWPKSDASVARIVFDDESPRVLWRVCNAPEGSRIHAKVMDVMGGEYELPSVPLHENSVTEVTLPGMFQLKDRLGVFRIEAWVEDSYGKHVSPVNEAILTRVHRPRFWNVDAPQSHFGIHMGPVTQQMILAKSIGINWVRLHDAGTEAVGWAFVEPQKGKWVWRDDYIARYRANHISILGMLSQSPGWASRLDHEPDYWEHYYEPADLNEYADYVRTITAHYKKDIRAWDVWNEPWIKFWTKYDPVKKQAYRSPQAAAEFAALERTAYTAAKSIDPSLTIMGLNTTAGYNGAKWTAQVKAANGLNTCDVWDYHHYESQRTAFPDDAIDKVFHDTFGPIANADGSFAKHIWMTEGNGTNTLIDRGFYNYSARGMETEDACDVAERMARYSVATLAHGVEKLFFYHINQGGEWKPGKEPFQTIVTDDCFPHPCAAALAQLAWEIDELKFVKRVQLASDVWGYEFAGNGRKVKVVSSGPGYQKNWPVPENALDLMGNKMKSNRAWDGRLIYIEG